MTTATRSPLMYAVEGKGKAEAKLFGFYDRARDVDWKSILKYADKSLDIMVFYWGTWVDTYAEELTQFLSKPGTRLRLVMSDARNPLILREMKRLFPEHNEAEIFARVKGTQAKLNAIAAKVGEGGGKLELFLVPRMLSYPWQRIDGEVVIYSLFEMCRQGRVDSPAVVGNLLDSEPLRQFFDKEWEGVQRESIRIDLTKGW